MYISFLRTIHAFFYNFDSITKSKIDQNGLTDYFWWSIMFWDRFSIPISRGQISPRMCYCCRARVCVTMTTRRLICQMLWALERFFWQRMITWCCCFGLRTVEKILISGTVQAAMLNLRFLHTKTQSLYLTFLAGLFLDENKFMYCLFNTQIVIVVVGIVVNMHKLYNLGHNSTYF